ncbi:DUF6193 family natural product biosynthesis protein [Kitasatospora sp. CM 4170]|uniref:DUF6193 family natural product biosynthesis protein n=1 Tax=Kitasatospora aburaviensis TaxID=67265 RepID=A0ABW1F6B9_9ACTN|nr:DUF6193 family natural product biosynthesis protein [Kitasatospora sp. CM 4170]WNM44131.1 DUF6193 family natural product biosynthesis protein [Kitasatospora sp. CM 4170]
MNDRRTLAEARTAERTEARAAELAEARERGPSHVVDLQWRRLRADAADAGYDAFVALLDAAAVEPGLRRLFPFTTMWVLCFGSDPGAPSPARTPAVLALPEGRFRVMAHRRGEVIGETDSAAAAVALVLARLPPSYKDIQQ